MKNTDFFWMSKDMKQKSIGFTSVTSFNKKTRGIPKKAKDPSIDPKKNLGLFWIIELKCVKQLELRHHKGITMMRRR